MIDNNLMYFLGAVIVIYIVYRVIETSISAMQRSRKSGIAVLVSAIIAICLMFLVGNGLWKQELAEAKAAAEAAAKTAKLERYYQECLSIMEGPSYWIGAGIPGERMPASVIAHAHEQCDAQVYKTGPLVPQK